ncbi:MAG: hypothetical protein R3F34_18070, partial [Planctomycetota bacterium]
VLLPAVGVDVPMLDVGGRPVVEAVLGGATLHLLLDTGSGADLILVPRAAREASVDGRARRSPGDGLAIGAAVVDAVELSVFDVFGGMPLVGDFGEVDGIVGVSCFEDCLLVLDFANDRVLLREGTLAADLSAVVALRRDPGLGGVPLVPLRVGATEIEAHLDTGSPDVLLVPTDVESRLALEDERVRVGTATTPMGSADIFVARLDGDLELGPLRIDAPWVRVADLPQIAGRGIGNVGSGALAGSRVTIDLASSRLAIESLFPVDVAATAPRPRVQRVEASGRHRVGLAVARSGEGPLRIAEVAAGGAGDEAGLRPGDLVVAARRTDGTEVPIEELGRAFGESAALLLTVERDGVTLSVRLVPRPVE